MIDKSVQQSRQIRPENERIDLVHQDVLKNKDLCEYLRGCAYSGRLPNRSNLSLGARLLFAYMRAFNLHMVSTETEYETIRRLLNKSEKQMRRYFSGDEPPFTLVHRLALAADLPIGWIAGDEMLISSDMMHAKHAQELRMAETPPIDSVPKTWPQEIATESLRRLGLLDHGKLAIDTVQDDFGFPSAEKTERDSYNHLKKNNFSVDDYLNSENEVTSVSDKSQIFKFEYGHQSIPEGFALIPRLDVQASAGNGALTWSEEPVDFLAFQESWLRARNISPKHARVLTTKGDSMEPTIRDGDVLLIDTSIDRVRDNTIYIVVYGGLVLVKRVHGKFDGSLMLMSDNERYPPEIVAAHDVPDLIVAGRVVWFGRSI